MSRIDRILLAVSKVAKIERDGAGCLLEEQDAPEHVLDDARHVLCRVLGLTSRNGDGLGTAICTLSTTLMSSGKAERTRKRRRHKHRGEAANAIDKRCARDVPVLATDVVVVHIAADIHDDAHDDENLHFVSG